MNYIIILIFSLTLNSCSQQTLSLGRDPAEASVGHKETKKFCIRALKQAIERANEKINRNFIYKKSGKHSFAFSNHEYHNTMMKSLNSFNSTYQGDLHHLEQQREGWNITLSDMVRFLNEKSQVMIKILEDYETNNSMVKDYIDEIIKKLEIKEGLNNEGRILDEKIDLNDKNHLEVLDNYNRDYAGIVGEFDYFMRLNNVVDANVYFSRNYDGNKEYSLLFSESINNLISKFNSRNRKEVWESINLEYRNLVKKSIRGPGRLLDFIESKEFDFITMSENGKWNLVEVKNYRGKVSMEVFKDSLETKRKSIYDQLNENLEILKRLELEDKFQISIVFKRGVTDDVKEELKGMGVHLIEKI